MTNGVVSRASSDLWKVLRKELATYGSKSVCIEISFVSSVVVEANKRTRKYRGETRSERNPVRLITPPMVRREDGEKGERDVDEVENRGAARCAEKGVDVAVVARVAACSALSGKKNCDGNSGGSCEALKKEKEYR